MADAQLQGIRLRILPLTSIRKDGQTQHRTRVDPSTIAEYSSLMACGVVFPPVRVWWDGQDFWLSDGFQRVAAAGKAGLSEIAAEIRDGSLEDARWDSYAANGAHGVRRTLEDTRAVIWLALRHPRAAYISNVEMARHLNIPEPTLRRWRKRFAPGGDSMRIVSRGATTYQLKVRGDGSVASTRRVKSRQQLLAEFQIMQQNASPKARRVLTILHKWAFGPAFGPECLDAIEGVLRS